MPDTATLCIVWAPRVLSIVRIVAGLIFMEHGTAKLFGFPYDPRLEHLQLTSLIGCAGVIEAVTGFLITIGLFTRCAAFVASGEMAFAYFMSHAPKGLYPMLNGGDAAILFCFVFLYLFAAGGGVWSVDRLRSPRA